MKPLTKGEQEMMKSQISTNLFFLFPRGLEGLNKVKWSRDTQDVHI